jgi:hypothetical protein
VSRQTRRSGARAVLVAVALLAVFAIASNNPARAEVRPICFPVQEPVTYTSSFGAPRSGHTHQGNDLIGQKMFHLLSAADGVIIDLRGPGEGDASGSAGNAIRIRGDDGWFHIYYHVNNDTPGTDDGQATRQYVFAPGIDVGVRVRGGQFVGYMGDSGNAEGSSPHLHYELRKPAPGSNSVWDSTAIDPYPSLQAAAKCESIASPTRAYDSLGGVLTSDADAAGTGSGRTEVFARGADNALWTRTTNDGSAFSAWASLGGVLRSGPTVVNTGGGRVDLFVRGQDDGLWQRTRNGSTWGQWQSLGGIITGDPDAAATGSGGIVVALRGRDQQLWYRQFDGSAWSGWATLHGGLATGSGPGLGSPSAGRVELFVRGTDNRMWHSALQNGTWTPWALIGGILTSDPDVAIKDGNTHIAVRGSDQKLYHQRLGTGTWSVMTTGAVGGGPSLAVATTSRIEVFAISLSGALFHGWGNGAPW